MLIENISHSLVLSESHPYCFIYKSNVTYRIFSFLFCYYWKSFRCPLLRAIHVQSPDMTYSSVFCSINKEKTKEIKKEKAQQRRKRATIEAKSLQVWQRIIGYKRNSSSREIRAKEVHRHASNFTIRSWGVFGKKNWVSSSQTEKEAKKKKQISTMTLPIENTGKMKEIK